MFFNNPRVSNNWKRLALNALASFVIFAVPLVIFSDSVHAAVNSPSPRPIDSSELSKHQNVSVVFSAADLSNPESIFGHVFIVFHSGDVPGPLDPVVEFYGMMSEVEMGMLKTVTSSIPGIYKKATFEEKVRTYDKEGRDLFVRRVRSSVTPSALAFKVEQLSKEIHEYDFLDRNCAFYLEYLLTSSAVFEGSSWAIRQPADVFYEYGDPHSEYAIKSTERSRIEFKQAVSYGNHDANAFTELKRGLDFYEARSIVLTGSVDTDLNSAIKIMFSSPPPPDVYPPPKSDGNRKYASLLVHENHIGVQYGGFDTRGLTTGDSVPSLSRLKVGEVTLRCERSQGCMGQVLAFETLTLPKEGLGLAKFLSVSGRFDAGLALNTQIGLGLGYRVGSLGVAIIPGVSVDSKYWSQRDSLADGLLGNRFAFTFLHKDSSTYFDLVATAAKKSNPLFREKTSFRITNEGSGLFFQTSFAEGFSVGVLRRFE